MCILVVELPIAVQYKSYTYFYFSSFEINLHWYVLNISRVDLIENFYEFVIKKRDIYSLSLFHQC